MVSVRESTFETNSSSCHSLTICNDSVKEKLKNYEAIYTGPFEYDDSGDLFINEIDASKLFDRKQVLEKLREFRDMTLEEEWFGPYSTGQQQWLRDHNFEDMSLKELVNYPGPDFDIWYALSIVNIDFTHPDTIFGGEERNTRIQFEKHVLDSKTKEPVTIAFTEIGD